MTIHEIVTEYLKARGYDGLYRPDQCACVLDDLMPCGEPSPDCEVGYKVPCHGDCEFGDHCDWHVGAEKPDVRT